MVCQNGGNLSEAAVLNEMMYRPGRPGLDGGFLRFIVTLASDCAGHHPSRQESLYRACLPLFKCLVVKLSIDNIFSLFCSLSKTSASSRFYFGEYIWPVQDIVRSHSSRCPRG